MTPVLLFKCLSDESRFKLVLIIAKVGESCVCDLTQALAQEQPKTSRQLADLRKCGILLDQRRGKWVYYRLNPQLPAWASSIIATCAASESDDITDAISKLTKTGCND